MLSKKQGIGVCFALLCAIQACTPACEECANQRTGTEFFPIEVGRFVEYEVSEEEVTLGRPATLRQYQLREVIAERYTDPTGQIAYRIARFRRNLDGQRWEPDSTITLRLKIDHAVRNENGRDFVKMLFPAVEKVSWNGNIYNNLGEDSYELKSVNKSLKVGGTTFDRTATVVQQNDSTLVNQDKRVEIYAADVGLIYRERVNVQFCSSTSACVGKAQVDFGTRQYIRYKNAGKE
ncbi:hypothetical protein [Runella sp.]|jgi:hypothetical protein|uniref:hypothetical protein n=1 Tax=Runella sp. TaxID=1960881 RepID=UPI00261E84D2|nr:hypothetical protein [Runella sp.]